jgi:hypothetical protein
MEPIDTFKKDLPKVAKARWSVLSLVVIAFGGGFGFSTLLNNASLSGKDATIENLNSRIATLEGEKADLEKKLAAVPVKQVDEEKLRHHQELIEKIPDFINEGRKILQTFEEKGDTDLIKTQSLDWQKKVLLLLSELGPAYAAPFQTAQGTLYVVGGHTDMEGNSVYSLLRGKIDVLNTFLAEMRR